MGRTDRLAHLLIAGIMTVVFLVLEIYSTWRTGSFDAFGFAGYAGGLGLNAAGSALRNRWTPDLPIRGTIGDSSGNPPPAFNPPS